MAANWGRLEYRLWRGRSAKGLRRHGGGGGGGGGISSRCSRPSASRIVVVVVAAGVSVSKAPRNQPFWPISEE